MRPVEKQKRIDFYKSAVIENYSLVKFSGDVAANIRKCENHLNFHILNGKPCIGHINWYYSKQQIDKYHGNVCVAFYLPGMVNDFNYSGSIRPSEISQHKEGKVKVLFSIIEDDIEKSALWTNQVFSAFSNIGKCTD